MSRIARIVAPGLPHHIVHRGNNRQMIFLDDSDRYFYFNLLEKHSDEYMCKINVYCLMSTHVHMVVIPAHTDSLAKMMQKVSMRYAQYINKKYRRTGRLWESRYYSAVIQKDAYLWAVCRYVERNPVRAKIAAHPEDFPWSSAGKYRIMPGRHDFLVPPWHDEREKAAYIKYRNMPDDDDMMEKIRRSSHQGKPIGCDEQIQRIADNMGVDIEARSRGRPSGTL